MLPGRYSQAGFLGSDERLADVIAQDAGTVRALGITCEAMAESLRALIQRTLASAGREALFDDHFEVRVAIYKGFQMCPWTPTPHTGQCTAGGGVEFGSVDWRIRNLRTRQELQGSGLAVHLIRDHHFFEGLKSPHRIDPVALARLLELAKPSATGR